MTKEALKLALEAGYKDLPTVRLAYQGFDIQHFTNLVIAAERHRVLAEEREALAQPEQEPVGYMVAGEQPYWIDMPPPLGSDLYTSPPRRQPLTDEQLPPIPSAYRDGVYLGYSQSDFKDYARAIEAAHGIGDKT